MVNTIAKRTWFICVTIVFLVLITTQEVEARSYSFPELTIIAEVHEDGSMVVTEHRKANFSGSYSGLFQWINKNSGEEVVDIIIMENGQPYDFNPGTEFGPAGTYLVEDLGSHVYIDWSFDATDEERTYTIQYRILNVVKVHDDVAEVYHQFVGAEWESGVDNVRVSLTLPAGANKEDIRAWGHGPLHGNVDIQSSETVTWDIQGLPANAFLTGRVTFPKKLVPNAANVTGEVALPNILKQEQKWANDANRQRSLAKSNWVVTFIIIITGIIYSIYMWRLHGKAYKTKYQGDYYRELPAEYTPAELGVLWRSKRITPDDVTATIMDLARRGYFRIDETTRDVKRLFKTIQAIDYKLTINANNDYENNENESNARKVLELQAHEQSLLELLFVKISNDQSTVTFSQLEEYADKNKKLFAAFWDKWVKELGKRGEELKFFEKHSSGNAGKHAIPGILMLFIGIVLLIWQISVAGVFIAAAAALIFIGFLYLISLAFHSRRTQEGEEQYAKWRAFRRFLQHFSNMDRHDIPSLVIWEHYLVYAVSLGIAKEVMKQLQLVYPSLEEGKHRFGYGWYYYNANIANYSGLTKSIDTMSSTISNSVQHSITTATSQSSSGAGGGGGFSGGGGGGFSGGGGGGAR